jgi:hypothetical protein
MLDICKKKARQLILAKSAIYTRLVEHLYETRQTLFLTDNLPLEMQF